MIDELDIDIYRVNGIQQEFDCLYCGCPVNHGDTARMVNGLAYCSEQCADSYDEYVRGTQPRIGGTPALRSKTGWL